MNCQYEQTLPVPHVKWTKPDLFRKSTLSIACFIILMVSPVIQTVSASSPTPGALMKKAAPVWAEGREKEMNLFLGFRGTFQGKPGKNYSLRITGSTLYRVFLNGKFLGYGPARAAHGFFRVDEYDLTKLVSKGENIVAVEVAGYNVNSYYTLDQPSFLQAEVESGGKVLLATGSTGGFEAFQIAERLQKVERYSFQRPFTEYYQMKETSELWKYSSKVEFIQLKLTRQPDVKLLSRNLLMPEFNLVRPVMTCFKGTIQFIKPRGYKKDRSLTKISEKFKGYREEELEVMPSQFMQEISNKTRDSLYEPFSGKTQALSENEFFTFDFGTDLSGFIGARVKCTESTKIIFYFDEVLTQGDVNTKVRMSGINNQIVYELEPGDYRLESFETYTFKYLKVIILKGKCSLEDLYLREYTYPENRMASFTSSNHKLNEIYRAARQTFRQNAVDVFMDCPSRERAGWLCDSYFTAVMEKDLTGKSAVAHNFYENYALPDSFAFLPAGMLPMCYPADHNDGVFIPNWALWFIIQVNDYAKRGGDPELISSLKPRIEKLLEYFSRFENEDGLLEKLESWIFVEWSKANSFVQEVNYPTNMLYSAALSDAAELYHNDSWKKKAQHVKQVVLDQSFNGNFFVDNAVRNSAGKLQPTKNTTEVCQYYAFFFNMATPATHPGLWKILTTGFGPERNDAITYSDVYKANAFIGNYLRMDILSRYGLTNQLLKEVQDYFYSMARITGTLWENMGSQASCNHGFASWLGHVLYRDILGISSIDYLQKEITIRFKEMDLDECSGVLPLEDDMISLSWKRQNNQIRYSLKIPPGYKLKIENMTTFELVKLN